ncbi:pirin family protein [Streptomyces iconiensis]|uniref:Pirin family protein n=1 Tax=Streptomyces iconiensis TaxID=1384038 RepID=A0ABT6ZNI7_9ACTN|nr:pirin-like bicupin family protein [Streptomyces iconiensis]MDJ1130622.1 pirin family protein [Streptomyces iconiensis]
MTRVWRGEDRYRGGEAGAGIETRHAFSFSGFYDPDNVNFGLLVACNEELLAPGAGFALHPHRDVEIVTWVAEGELEHRDSAGHSSLVGPGDVQRLSAGSGVRHTERNAGDVPLRFVQMWLVPGAFGTEPEYEIVRGIADGTPFALPRTEAVMHVRRLGDGERTAVPDAAFVYVHAVRGEALLDGETLRAGDAARITDARDLEARGRGGAELLLWEMHAEPSYG